MAPLESKQRWSILDRIVPSPFYTVKGAVFLWHHRELWKYATAPLIICSVILAIAYLLLVYAFSWLTGSLQDGQSLWRIVAFVLFIVVTVCLLVVAFFVFTRLASALSAPFNELISQRTEEIVRGTFRDTPFSLLTFLRNSGRAISHALMILGIYVALLLASLLLLLIPVVGAILFFVVGALISSYMVAYEYFGYPMDRRTFSFAEKRKFLRAHLRAAMGFGLGNLAFAAIPLVNLIFIPAAAVGGTLLFLDLDGADAKVRSSR